VGGVFTKSHYFKDEKMHAYGSNSICTECLRIHDRVKAQMKISTLEEKLNAAKALDPEVDVKNYQK